MIKFFVVLAAIANAIMITVGIAFVVTGVQLLIGVILVVAGIPLIFLLRKKFMELNQRPADFNEAVGNVVAVGTQTLGESTVTDSVDVDCGGID
ncbi:MAG: hypothetical protein HQM14_06245 [SAR324 cluster bacterium]|nr:hypothetical protein [SAR324 cluster bacterium]